ncbi:MAG: hypothetical protein DSZ32_05560 [Gammaproteobacteria bacterium]|nr:MAG: hypothetical protein DSZ32_05560 [Gammaproteobacteria bacterium]
MEAIYKIQYTEKHLLTSIRRYREQVPWRRPFIKYRWPLVALFFFALVLGIGYNRFVVIVASGFLGSLLIGWPIDAMIAKNRFKKSPYCHDKIKITLTDRGMEASGTNSQISVDWPMFTKARRFDDGFLLFQGPHLFNWLPDEKAESAASVKTALELVRENVVDYSYVKP